MINKINPKILLTVSVLLAAIVCSTATAKTTYVDANATGANNGSSWDDAYNYLQDALADANSSTKPVEIWVAQGIYKPDQGAGQTPGDRTTTFQLINYVAIYGGFPSGGGFWESRDPNLYETTLSGDLSGNDADVNDPCDLLAEPTRAENSYHVVTGSGTNTTAVLDGFTITGGNANSSTYPDGRGAGMLNDSGTPRLYSCILTANACLKYGGGMHNRGSNPHLADCVFASNTAGELGGGIFNWGSSSALVRCDFSENAAARGGGMFNYENSSPQITNCNFENNRASDNGGAIENYENCNAVITWCSFNNNTADYGGGMINYKSNPDLTDCDFSGNQANKGGGMYNWEGSRPVLTNCTFKGNWAYLDGGAIKNYDNCNIVITSCSFNNNTAEGGGGMFNEYSSPTLTDCSFSSNSAGWGGAMYNWASSPTLTGCTFSKNQAETNAGAMLNLATGQWWENKSNPELINCTFTENSAVSGCGCMYNSASEPTLINCTFTGNSRRAIYNSDDSYIDPWGTIHYCGSWATLINCNISYNSGWWAGAVHNDNYSGVTVTSCILWGNTSLWYTGQMAQIYDGTKVISYCCIQGWTGSWGGVGNTGDDPNFVDANGPDGVMGTFDDNLRLSSGSPCIDAGDNNSVPTDVTTDLDGRPRFIDDLCTNDAGNPPGADAVVDMGAYEFAYTYFGDFDGDCNLDVNLVDFAIFGLAWLTEPGHLHWNPECDISIPPDNSIDVRDLSVFVTYWLAGVEP